MSTPANIIIANRHSIADSVWLYRRHDGYPEYQGVKGPIVEVLETLQTWVVERKIRDNMMQAAAWFFAFGWNLRVDNIGHIISKGGPSLWDANVFWPSPPIVGDVAYIYGVVFSNSFLNSDPWMKWKVFHPDRDEVFHWIMNQ